jgi:glycosyltransferase involved in cell wall biosynthesis
MKVKSPEVSIVVPTLNESRNINRLVALLDKAMGAMDWEIIFVDDDSPDGTWQVAKAIARSDRRIRSIRRIDRRGLAGACIEGMLSSSAPYLAVMDADLQHDEKILPVMIAPLVSDEADLVIGTRMTKDKDHGFSAQRAEVQRNLLYTGVTRGKRLVILLGQKKAVAIAVKNVSGRRRWSKLREWLNPVGFSIPRLIGA